MKNVTVSLDDVTYATARVKAARAGRSLSALVREFLQKFGSEPTEFERLHAQELELRERIDGFQAGDRMTRDEVYERRR